MVSHCSNRPSSRIVFGLAALCASLAGGCEIVAGVRDVVLYIPSGEASWAKRFGDIKQQIGTDIAVDGANDVVVTGSFQGAIDFGGGQLLSEGAGDIFVAKLDAAGGHVWSKRFGDENNQTFSSVAVDGLGNVLISGAFLGAVDFGGGPLVSAGMDNDIFVAKLDPAGNHIFSRRFGDEASQVSTGITADGHGNVLLTGYISGSVDFGGGALPEIDPSSDAFISKLDPMGNHLWSKRFGNAGAEDIATDGLGDVIITGQFGSTDFGGGALPNADAASVFLAKLDRDGNHVWSKGFGDTSAQVGSSVAVDGVGNIAVTGYFQGNMDLGNGSLMSAGGDDIFVAKFEIDGECLWSERFGDVADEQRGNAVAVDNIGGIFVTGALVGTADFGGGKLTSTGPSDVFAVKFDASGNHIWSKGAGDAHQQVGMGIVADGADSVLVIGYMGGSINFGFVELPGNSGNEDAFIVNLKN